MNRMVKHNTPVADRAYALLLRAYPREFRCEYGPHMAQVFRDCYRAEQSSKGVFGLVRLWSNVLLDVVQSAPRERLDNLGKEDSFMSNLRRDAAALLVCSAIIVIAFFLLSYGRRNEVSSILTFGYILDAVVVTGVVGNLVVFLLAKTTKLNPLRAALWTFLVINAAPAIALAIVGARLSTQFNLGAVLIGYVVSFLFWFGLHWIWARTAKEWAVSPKQ